IIVGVLGPLPVLFAVNERHDRLPIVMADHLQRSDLTRRRSQRQTPSIAGVFQELMRRNPVTGDRAHPPPSTVEIPSHLLTEMFIVEHIPRSIDPALPSRP